jgi:hypothetical protein
MQYKAVVWPLHCLYYKKLPDRHCDKLQPREKRRWQFLVRLTRRIGKLGALGDVVFGDLPHLSDRP